MTTEIGSKIKSLDLLHDNELRITDVTGNAIYICGDNNFIDLLRDMLLPFKKEAKEIVSKVENLKLKYGKVLTAVILGKREYNTIRLGWGITNDSIDRIVGITVYQCSADSLFDYTLEHDFCRCPF